MMSNRFDNFRLTTLEEQAYTEVIEHFAEHLQQFPVSREGVQRLERDLAKIALAANMATSKTTAGNSIFTEDGQPWHRSVDLLDNRYLCHRPITGSAEYAVVEHIPARGTHEIRNQGPNAVEVLKAFAQEQRQALEVWTEAMAAQVQQFLAEKYPGQNMSRVADSFMRRFTHAIPQPPAQSHEQNHSRRIRS
jgi:hypothetical protein